VITGPLRRESEEENMLDDVEATQAERATPRRGDDLLTTADVVMDRGFTVPGRPEDVWPWVVQLGKRRAGWYLSRRVERTIPPARRAIRQIDPRWQELRVGEVIPDWGGRHATFTVAALHAPHELVYRSARGALQLTWSITLEPVATPADHGGPSQTRVLLRLRMGPVKRVWLARSGGELLDRLTVLGLAAGLRERLADVA
jgi:hypothetical protein